MNNSHNFICSIIMPAYNCSAYLAGAIESVLAQSYTEWELLLFDDCSTDDTFQIATALARSDSRIIVCRNEHNMGVAATRNQGLASAKGAYIAFWDADDIWRPDKLAVQIALLQNSAAQLCYSSYRSLFPSGEVSKVPYLVPSTTTLHELLKENVIGCSTVVLEHSCLQGVTFRTQYAHEDFVFWLELLQKNVTFIGCTENLTIYRTAVGRSADKKRAALNRWQIYRVFLKMGTLQSLYYFIYYSIREFKKHFPNRQTTS